MLAVFAAPAMPRWGFMWAMAFALYAGCKWLTYRDAGRHSVTPSRARAIGYLVAWPGMDAGAFLRPDTTVPSPRPAEWLAAALKIIAGTALIWVAPRTAFAINPLLAGWIGMVGLVLLLHFGTFHVLSLGWRSLGVNAMPVMRNPMRSTSLAEFWGRRWNTAFHELATRFTFRPLRARVGRTGATLLAFLASGLIHELVISVPAGAGYGLPSVYFMVQGLGVAAERTRLARRLGLGQGARGGLFAVTVAAVPAFWLFPPSFVRNIILPMLATIGAL